MPLAQAETVFNIKELGGPVLVEWGVITGSGVNLIATVGNRLFLFSPSSQGYSLDAVIDVETMILSLAVGLQEQGFDKIILGTEEKVLVYGKSTVNEGGNVVRIWESETEPDARFIDLDLAALHHDNGEMVIAASEGKEALYIYQTVTQPAAGQLLELLAIRALPGPAQKVTTLSGTETKIPLIAVAYKENLTSGLLTLYQTEMGFAEIHALENLPSGVSALISGDLRPAPGEELVWGGNDGIFRIIEIDEEMITVLNSDNLGADLPALAAGRLIKGIPETLLAGTNEGYLFGYAAPVENSSPDWTVFIVNPVHSLAISEEGLVGLGTADGGLQVWRLVPEGYLPHLVKPGETLADIAAAYNMTIDMLIKTNNINNPDLIFPGQIMFIPRA